MKPNEDQAFRDCLNRALRPTDARIGGRGLARAVFHPKEAARSRSRRRQTARDLAALSSLDDLFLPAREPEPAPDSRTDSADAQVVETKTATRPAVQKTPAHSLDTGSRTALLEEVGKLAARELRVALAVDEFVPWQQRVAGVLAGNAEAWHAHLEETVRKGEPGVEAKAEKSLRQLSEVVEDRAAGVGGTPKKNDFLAFGDRVSLRLVANMTNEPTLGGLVARLDLSDQRQAEAAMATAVQGIRVAVLSGALILTVAAGSLLELAITHS
jgi:hypothetical protein